MISPIPNPRATREPVPPHPNAGSANAAGEEIVEDADIVVVAVPPPRTSPSGENGSANRGEPALEIRHLNRFFGRLRAVDDVTFSAYPGQVMGFIGPNGAGKTTTMRILATLDTPTAGDAFVCGYSVVDDPDKVRGILGFMPDSFGRYHNVNVVEYLDFFGRAYGLRGQRLRDSLERVLVFTELRKLAEKPIDTLSKGMSQRLGLGRTLIHDPEVLVLDEPAAGLDPRARVELRELIHLLARDLNKTVLISSHILTELGEICNSAAIIEAGRILIHGTMDEIRSAQRRKTRGERISTTLLCRVIQRGSELERWLWEQSHVSEVKRADQILTFDFEGTAAEQSLLLKNMLLEEFEVLEFQGKTESLEDAFMAITEGITQ